jgi:phage baseplate assembly protein W
VPRNTPLKNSIFRDLDLDFNVHPNSKNLITLKDDAAVRRALRNLLLTEHYDRPFHPEIGSNIRRTLFENFGPQTEITLRNEIRNTIKNFEPRVDVQEIIVEAIPEENRYSVTLHYYIVNDATIRTAQLFLERLR